jgi:ankyrin repeat protein
MIKSFLPAHLVEAIGWSLLHSLWQGALLAFLLAILLLMMRKFSAQTRYLIIALCMGVFVAILPVNFIRLYHPHSSSTTSAIDSNYGKGSNTAEYRADPSVTVPITQQQVSHSLAGELSRTFIRYFDKHLPLIVTGWLMGMLVLLLRFVGQLIYLQQLIHHGAVPFALEWMKLIESLQVKMNLSKKVTYLSSLRISTPLTLGWLKPVILFPMGLLTKLSPQEVEVILLHELAHIKRHDYFFHVLASLASILFFYHPAIYYMSTLLDGERENCCDDLVVSVTGQPERYATTLIHLQEQKLLSMKTSLSITGAHPSFRERILRVLNHSLTSANRFGEGFATALVLVVGIGFLTTASIQATPAGASTALSLEKGSKEKDQEKVDLLLEAIDEEDEKLFNYMLKQGVDINGTSSEGWTPLGYAAREGKLSFVEVLLEKGAKINQVTRDGHHPLLAAAGEGHVEIVKLLLAKGASANVKQEGNTALFVAAREGHTAIVRLLLPLNPPLKGEEKVDLLLSAIDENQQELFEYWLSQGADLNGTGRDGWTPLGFAAEEGRLVFVKSLIAKGANINYPSKDERMPYLAAAGEGKLAVVEVLLEAGVKADQSSENGTTALSMAAREGHGHVVDYLLSKGANVNKANSEGWTALHFATTEGHTEQMKRLITAGAKLELPISTEWTNISMRSGRRVIMGGWTPLMLAIEEEKVEAAEVLLEAGANVNVKVDKTVYALEGDWQNQKVAQGKLFYEASGWTPLMEAVEKQNLALVKLLLSRGADKNAQTKQGRSVKSIAHENGNKQIMSLLE